MTSAQRWLSQAFLDPPKAGDPNLWDLMPGDPRWSWCNNNRNKCTGNVMCLSHPQTIPHPRPWKDFLRESGPRCQKDWGPVLKKAAQHTPLSFHPIALFCRVCCVAGLPHPLEYKFPEGRDISLFIALPPVTTKILVHSTYWVNERVSECWVSVCGGLAVVDSEAGMPMVPPAFTLRDTEFRMISLCLSFPSASPRPATR